MPNCGSRQRPERGPRILYTASSEGRFTIRWCPGQLSKEEVESVGFEFGHLKNDARALQARKGFGMATTALTAKRSSLFPIQG